MNAVAHHQAAAGRLLAAAERLAACRPPRTARRAGLRLDRIDTLRGLADSHLRAGLLAARTPSATEACDQWTALLAPEADTETPRKAAPGSRTGDETAQCIARQGPDTPNAPQSLSDGLRCGIDAELDRARQALLRAEAARHTAEAERDQHCDEAAGLRMELHAVRKALTALHAAAASQPDPSPALVAAATTARQLLIAADVVEVAA